RTYEKEVNGANDAAGRPARLRDYFPLPNVDIGPLHTGGTFLDPLRGLGFTKFLEPNNYGNGTIGQILGGLEAAGFSPGLIPSMAATIAQRLNGENPEPRSILPQTDWLKYGSAAATGHPIDVEAGLKNLLYGTSQDKRYDYEVQKELLAQL